MDLSELFEMWLGVLGAPHLRSTEYARRCLRSRNERLRSNRNNGLDKEGETYLETLTFCSR